MNVYMDTSVILSHLLDQPNQLSSWGVWDTCYTSVLTQTEFSRTVDRMRLVGAVTDLERVRLQEQFKTIMDMVHQVVLSQELLDRACGAMPTVLATLDALHLVTALKVMETEYIQLTFLTHDQQLATGAMEMGLEVLGAAFA